MKVRPDREAFVRWLESEGPPLSPEARERLLAYGGLIREAHPRLGLVSTGDRERIYTRHILESLAPPLLDAIDPDLRLVDVGSGAGLPGIPLAIARPDLDITLIEPRERRAGFLERARLSLGLERLVVFAGTVETVVRDHPELQWQVAVSRALRWKPGMLAALGAALEPDGVLIRFGSPDAPAGVSVQQISTDPPRAIQIWPQSAWGDLADAR